MCLTHAAQKQMHQIKAAESRNTTVCDICVIVCVRNVYNTRENEAHRANVYCTVFKILCTNYCLKQNPNIFVYQSRSASCDASVLIFSLLSLDPGAFEGDIILDPDEKVAIAKGGNAYGSIKGWRWKGGVVPYEITSSIGPYGRRAIEAAIKQYHQHTCLRFKKKTNEWRYISFYKGNGCSSPVGQRLFRKNSISLGPGCWSTGIVMHEIGHSIGLYHEQSRPDRDNYVKILWNNIEKGMSHNFNKQSTLTVSSLGTKYDFLSMIHYGSTAFGRGRMTIQTKDPSKQRLIGQRRGFSDIDIKQINLMYGCNK
ncbi:zinc metalloproteinase nas-6-like [Hydractinia symbiolongicarpus]|uniref:zinc metalloproteinase nas-6-like n=1 Tax=Hydractinia symbiolongicarpus TaxID=13093 RepID=UPI00254C952D|nr:zinc metalloproteinase nas-6-like [Hydractinia symbiolongicarpus]